MWQCGIVLAMLTAVAAASTGDNETFPFALEVSSASKASLRKCCPEGERFNLDRRTCQVDGNWTANSAWETVVGMMNPYNVTFGSPLCRPGEAFADILSFSNDSLMDVNGDIHLRGSWTESLKAKDFCVDAVTGDLNALLIQACVRSSTICEKASCIPKCCPFGQHYFDESNECSASVRSFVPQFYKRIESSSEGPPVFEPLDVISEAKKAFEADPKNREQILYAQVSGIPCPHDMYVMDPEIDADDKCFLTRDGYLNHPPPPFSKDVERYSMSQYCIEDVVKPEGGGLRTFVCFPREEKTLALFDILLVVGLSISSFFLIATLLTYAILPSLQNLHGKTLMAHVTSLLVAYICLMTVQLADPLPDSPSCKAIGFCMLYTFLSAFSWLNIMCIDIWWTFGAVRSSSSSRRRARNRFWAYCIYALGFPTIVTAAGICVEYLAGKDILWRPALGQWGCWFSYDTRGALIFFYGPVGAQLAINFTLFVLTVRYCAKVRSDISRFQDSQTARKTRKINADKRKLAMCAKLFVVMGVTWAIEVISSMQDTRDGILYIADAPNTFNGVIIFCIFVLKRRVLRALGSRFGSWCGVGQNNVGGTTIALALASESSPSIRSSIRVDDRQIVRKSPSSSTLCADARGKTSPRSSCLSLAPDIVTASFLSVNSRPYNGDRSVGSPRTINYKT